MVKRNVFVSISADGTETTLMTIPRGYESRHFWRGAEGAFTSYNHYSGDSRTGVGFVLLIFATQSFLLVFAFSAHMVWASYEICGGGESGLSRGGKEAML